MLRQQDVDGGQQQRQIQRTAARKRRGPQGGPVEGEAVVEDACCYLLGGGRQRGVAEDMAQAAHQTSRGGREAHPPGDQIPREKTVEVANDLHSPVAVLGGTKVLFARAQRRQSGGTRLLLEQLPEKSETRGEDVAFHQVDQHRGCSRVALPREALGQLTEPQARDRDGEEWDSGHGLGGQVECKRCPARPKGGAK